jgi:hypothetical protein
MRALSPPASSEAARTCALPSSSLTSRERHRDRRLEGLLLDSSGKRLNSRPCSYRLTRHTCACVDHSSKRRIERVGVLPSTSGQTDKGYILPESTWSYISSFHHNKHMAQGGWSGCPGLSARLRGHAPRHASPSPHSRQQEPVLPAERPSSLLSPLQSTEKGSEKIYPCLRRRSP